MDFTQNAYDALLAKLISLSDATYKIFNDKLTPGCPSGYGVRIPQLRALAKEIAKGDWRGFLALAKDDSSEEIMLQGMVINFSDCCIGERLSYADCHIAKINSWALCDVYVGDFKSARKEPEAVSDFLRNHLSSNKEYILRFVLIMRMNYFLDDAHADETLRIIKSTAHEGYYVKMAQAWALATAYAKQCEKTRAVLAAKSLEPFVQNKAIQKIRESYRVSREEKNRVLAYKL